MDQSASNVPFRVPSTVMDSVRTAQTGVGRTAQTGVGRQARALRNDARILDAAARIAASEGWAALVPSRVAAQSGLVRSTIQDRFRDRSALGVALWRARCGPSLSGELHRLIDASDDDAVVQAMHRLTATSDELLAAGELLVAAHYDHSLRAVVNEDLGREIRDWCGSADEVANARAGYLLMVGIGLLLAARRTGAAGLEWTSIAQALGEARTVALKPATLPEATAPHITGELDLAPDDPPLNALLNAALREIGSLGFEGASVDRITRASQNTKGLLFSRFPSKLELFLEATRRQQTMAFAANDAFLQEVAQGHGRGIAEAVAIRELQKPHLAYARSIAMEQLRLSWHNRELKAAQEADLDAVVAALAESGGSRFPDTAPVVHFAYAVGLGMAALPLLLPGSWELPYDVMTVPLVDMGL